MSNIEAMIGQRFKKFISTNTILAKHVNQEIEKNIVKCLIDGSVYSIVNSLNHLQELKET